MLVDALSHHRISLIVVLQQHFQTRNRHTDHLSKLIDINRALLCLKHSRFACFQLFHLVNIIVVRDTFCIQSSLLFFVCNVTLLKVLPFIIHLLIYQPVCFLKTFTNLVIFSLFDLHLHLDKFSHKFMLCFQKFHFHSIRVFEMICLKV